LQHRKRAGISKKSFDDAITQGVVRANKTLNDVKGLWIKHQEILVDTGKIAGCKVTMKVTFVLAD
jgi:flavin-binding protein dodecin